MIEGLNQFTTTAKIGTRYYAVTNDNVLKEITLHEYSLLNAKALKRYLNSAPQHEISELMIA